MSNAATVDDLTSGRLITVPDRQAEIRSIVVKYATDEDVREVWAVLLGAAKGGDIKAIREFLDRTIGRPQSQFEIVKLPELIEAMSAMKRIIAEEAPKSMEKINERIEREVMGGAT